MTTDPPSDPSLRPRAGRAQGRIALAFLCAVAVAASACSSSSPTAGESAPPEGSPVTQGGPVEVEPIVDEIVEPATAWEAALAGVDEDGSVSLDAALHAFSVAFSPLPGVELDPDLDVDHDEVTSGTGALAWVLRHWDDLTTEQRDAVGAALGGGATDDGDDEGADADGRDGGDVEAVPVDGAPPLEAPAIRSLRRAASGTAPSDAAAGGQQTATKGCFGQPLVDADSPGAERYRPELDDLVRQIEQRLGGSIRLRMPLHLVVERVATVDAAAYTWSNPVSCGENAADHCTIHLNPIATRKGPRELRSILAHEAFHCFQFQRLGMEGYRLPPWIGEGMAAWVGEDLAGGTAMATKWWTRYLTQPAKGLYGREYDAIGFYAQLEEVGIDPWANAARVMEAGDNDLAFEIATTFAAQQFLESWPSGYARLPDLGAAWDISMPGITDDRPTVPARTVGDGAVLTLTTAPVTNRLVSLTVSTDLVDLETDGYLRISDGTRDDVVAGTGSYCIRPGGCTCPDGGDGGSLAPELAPEAKVALTGGASAASARISGRALACEDEGTGGPEPGATAQVDPCLVGRWRTEPFAIPGPMPGVDAHGGEGAVAEVLPTGEVLLDFGPMEANVSHDPQIDSTTWMVSDGQGRLEVSASGGTWTVHRSELSGLRHALQTDRTPPVAMPTGPAIHVLGASGTYSCARDSLEYRSPDPVLGGDITVTLTRIG